MTLKNPTANVTHVAVNSQDTILGGQERDLAVYLIHDDRRERLYEVFPFLFGETVYRFWFKR
jgi:hypothetical protein